MKSNIGFNILNAENSNYFIGVTQSSETAKYTLNKDDDSKEKSHKGSFQTVKLLFGEKIPSRGLVTILKFYIFGIYIINSYT